MNKKALSILAVVVLAAAGVAIFLNWRQSGRLPGILETVNPVKISQAVQEGKKYFRDCQGEEIKKLTNSPIDAADITTILPYGAMVGAHVMPVSHAYIWPGKMGDPRDKYNVYAMGDATLFSISSRAISVDTGQAKAEEYSLAFSVSCVEFYYYDLMTSLTPELKKFLDQHPSQQSGNSVNVSIPVKAGQLLGKIGAQTLDYAVWDMNKTLTGYIEPAHYDGDFPRTHLVDPLDYATDELKQTLLAKYVRSAEPVSGQVDYDIDGKLIGGWFEEGTGYYIGQNQSRYWAGHLAVAPEYLDPTLTIVSIGTYGNRELQMSISRDAPDPRMVGVETGPVKYDLLPWDYIDGSGANWDRKTPAKGLKATNAQFRSRGCAVFQLMEGRKLKAEFFPDQACSGVPGLTGAAKTYTR
jgi:hypothetical protein